MCIAAWHDLLPIHPLQAAEWSLNMMSNGAFKLREAERSAKQQRVGQWHNYVPQTGNSSKLR